MSRKVFIIGIGAGNPDFVTIQAVNAMNRVDVFFIPNKGIEKDELARVRREILERYVRNHEFRIVEFDAPDRHRAETEQDYQEAVSDWHGAVEAAYGKLIMEELDDTQSGAFLVWGDPAVDGDLDIYWGAYIGMPDEVLVAGKLKEVIDDIERIRNEARASKGWVMDTVLIKRGTS